MTETKSMIGIKLQPPSVSKAAIYVIKILTLFFQNNAADEKGGPLNKRVIFYMDKIGTLPRIDSSEMIFSTSRSQKVSIVVIIQSLAQFEKTYGKEGMEIIVDNCQLWLWTS